MPSGAVGVGMAGLPPRHWPTTRWRGRSGRGRAADRRRAGNRPARRRSPPASRGRKRRHAPGCRSGRGRSGGGREDAARAPDQATCSLQLLHNRYRAYWLARPSRMQPQRTSAAREIRWPCPVLARGWNNRRSFLFPSPRGLDYPRPPYFVRLFSGAAALEPVQACGTKPRARRDGREGCGISTFVTTGKPDRSPQATPRRSKTKAKAGERRAAGARRRRGRQRPALGLRRHAQGRRSRPKCSICSESSADRAAWRRGPVSDDATPAGLPLGRVSRPASRCGSSSASACCRSASSRSLASIDNARANRAKAQQSRRRPCSPQHVQRFTLALSRNAFTIRAARDAIIEAGDPGGICRRTLERLGRCPNIARPLRHLRRRPGAALRRAPGFAPPAVAAGARRRPAAPRSCRAAICSKSSSTIRRRDRGHRRISTATTLAAAVDTPPLPGDFALELVQGDRVMPLRAMSRRRRRGGPQVSADNPFANGQYSLRMRIAAPPMSLSEILIMLTPILMWLWASLVGWIIVQRLLLRPLGRIQNVISAYKPGDRGVDLPAVRSPAAEIGALGQAFDRGHPDRRPPRGRARGGGGPPDPAGARGPSPGEEQPPGRRLAAQPPFARLAATRRSPPPMPRSSAGSTRSPSSTATIMPSSRRIAASRSSR